MSDKSDKEVLEEFIHDNEELERLEEIAEDFNIFTALRIVDTELKHSTFLAWLMDPNESHGLGDYFLSLFLRKAAFRTSASGIDSPSVFDIDSWHFDSAEVLREYQRIDIFIRSEEHKFICVIENKIQSGEHDNQLKRYRRTVQNEYPCYRKLFIYLTISGDIPSDDSYIPLSYEDIIPLIERLVKTRKEKIGSEILIFISHYKDMLRRYVMEDSKIQDICKGIYKRHRKALDLIFEYRPDKQLEVCECLVNIIKRDPDLILDGASKSYIRFIPKEFDDFIPPVGVWDKSKRMLLFDTYNGPQGVIMYLSIRPGPKEIRQKLYEIARENLSLFNLAKNKLTGQFTSIYRKSILSAKDHEDKEIEEIGKQMEERFRKFKETDLPKLVAQIIKFDENV